MSRLAALRFRLGALLRPAAYARELDEELRFHLALDAMQQEHAGRGALSPADARFGARRRFGNVTVHTEEARAMAGLRYLDEARQDARFALRALRRSPGFTLVAVLTLAVGIGANTAIFSAVHALLLRPLPFAEPERLMKVSLTRPPEGDRPGDDDTIWSYPKFAAFRDAQRAFADLAPHAAWELSVQVADGDAERTRVEMVGARYLATLGVRPALGRDLGPDEDRPGAPRVALLSDGYWQRRFGADPAVVGRTVQVDGKPFTVAGVLPPGFRGLSGGAELWVPLLAMEPEYYTETWNHSYEVVGRLRDGVAPAQATAATRALGPVVNDAFPHPDGVAAAWGATARSLDAIRVDPRVRRSLLVLLGAVGLVLLVACANVANLFLVRAAGRRREIAVRLAVGAGRGRLIRQLLTESLLLALLGGVASVAVAWWGVRLLGALDPSRALRIQQMGGLGVVGFDGIRLDVPALLFALALALGTGVLFGLAPALAATRRSVTGALKNAPLAARGAAGRLLSARHGLAALEIALAVVLLAGSGLLLRSLGNLLAVRPGFDAERVLTLRVSADALGRDTLPAFYDELLVRLRALPGVEAAGLGNCAPLSGGCNGTALIRRDRPEPAPGTAPSVGVHWATGGLFPTLRTPLVRGRLFGPEDRPGGRKAVLLNATAARRLYPDEDPIGRPVSVGQGGFHEDTAYVVGVVGDVRYGALDGEVPPEVYLPYPQSPNRRVIVFVRTAGDPLALVGPARAIVRELAPGSPVYDVRTLADRTGDASAYARFAALLLALFAGAALLLATIGVYGVVSFGVAQRTHEIGVRMALGASRRDVLRLVVGQGLAIVAAGALVGVLAALATTRLIGALLYGVTPADPLTFGAIVAVLGLAVVAASWLPARRASGVPPTEALREA